MKNNQLQLVEEFRARTECSLQRANQIIQLLYDTTTHLIKQNMGMHNFAELQVSLSSTQMRKSLGRIGPRHAQKYVWDIIVNECKHRPLVPVLVGSNVSRKKTIYKVNQEFLMQILQHSTSNTYTSCKTPNASIRTLIKHDESTDWIPIDVENLTSYIANTLRLIEMRQKQHQDVQQLLKYVSQAQQVLSLVNSQGYIEQTHSQNGSNRNFYKGFNLKNISKPVRVAALGSVWEYDLNCSVFSWKLSVLHMVLQETCHGSTAKERNHQAHLQLNRQLPYTMDLVLNKSQIRKQLAKECFGNTDEYWVKIVKQIITAIGFGAPLRDSRWHNKQQWQCSSIRDIVRSPHYRMRVIENKWLINFVQEQKVINNMLADIFARNAEGWQQQQSLNSAICQVYQHAETQLVQKLIAQHASANILLAVHDCIYTSHKIDLASSNDWIQNEYYYMKLNCEHYASKPVHEQMHEQIEQHKQLIEQQQKVACIYKNHYVQQPMVKSFDREFMDLYIEEFNNKRRMAQLASDCM